ncbi:hypothetical protein QN277_027667 [Acacia crassicarpa]|uniref:Uncharacterized protein n=1 Tax=Acacia crassicarpa TaxID=499986 RepID=A0AAE1MCD5_9FABA|nr:hypothetical protein QN277_027667 [Acacia crassicarpa]
MSSPRRWGRGSRSQ